MTGEWPVGVGRDAGSGREERIIGCFGGGGKFC